jgi:hypothetical protein
MTVKPTASGDVGVTIPAGAVTNGALTNTAAVTATIVKVALGTSGVDTFNSTQGADYVFPGAGNDILKLTNANQSTVTAPDTIVGVAVGDLLDLSGLLGSTGAGYGLYSTPSGPGFVEIKNLAINPRVVSGVTSTTSNYVEFDVCFDSHLYSSSNITGAKIDLSYDNSKVSSILVTGYSGGELGANTWTNITSNAVNGQFVSPINSDLMDASKGLDASQIIESSTGKAFHVRLTTNTVVSDFAVGIESKSAGGDTYLTTVTGGSTGLYPDVNGPKSISTGSTKVLTVKNDSNTAKNSETFTTLNDNEIHYLEVLDGTSGSAHLLFKYDTNSATGTATPSEVIRVNLVGSTLDTLNTFLASDYGKVL